MRMEEDAGGRGPQIADHWLAAFEDFASAMADADWMRALRRDAIARFGELGLPDRSLEAWRYTSLARLDRSTLALPTPVDTDPAALRLVAETALAEISLPERTGPRIIFVDGHLCAELSDLPPANTGILFQDFASLRGLDEAHASERKDFGALANDPRESFTALNTAFVEDGARIEILPDSTHAERIHLLFISSGATRLICPRLLVRVGSRSRANILLDHVSIGGGESLVNPVGEIFLDDHAELDWIHLQRESGETRHFSNFQISQARGSRLDFHNLTLGGGLVRNQVGAVLAEEGAEIRLQGLFIGREQQHIDNYTEIEHATSHTLSRQLYKGVLDDRSRGVFRGLIRVQPNAYGVESLQSNPNLLLSERARMDTRPQLEIHADDVRCAHGSTIGQLDRDALFYLRARGLSESQAAALLTRAFVAEIYDALPDPSLRDFVAELASAGLAGEAPDREGVAS